MSIIYCERILKNSLRLLCVLCTIYMVSCDTNDIEDTNQQSRRKNIQVRIVGPGTTDSIVECLQGIPFASYDELLSYSGEDGTDCYGTLGVLNYNFARDYAMAEFLSNAAIYIGNQQIRDEIMCEMSYVSISKRPVVVYDYNDRPFYYEFPILYRMQQIIGIIAVSAQPFNKELIHYMFPFPLTYRSHNFTYRRYVGEYPLVYYSTDGETFYKEEYGVDDSVELKEVKESYYIADIHDAMLAKIADLNQEALDNINLDLTDDSYIEDGDIISLSDYVNYFQRTQETIDFWNDKIGGYNPSSSDHDEISAIVMGWIDENLSEVTASHQGFLPEYNDYRLRLTQWNGYCGPAIMAWLYRGKYDSYNELYLPIFTDPDSYDYTIYPDLQTGFDHLEYYMQPYWYEQGDDYPTIVQTHSERTDNGLFNAFFQFTDEMCGAYPLLDWGLRASLPSVTNSQYSIKFITAPISWMKNNLQPVVVEGIRGKAHYCGAIGYSYNQWWFIKTYMRLLVTDNGYFLKDHHNYPFWSILGGLNYAWQLND